MFNYVYSTIIFYKMNRTKSLLLSVGEAQTVVQIKVYKSTNSKSRTPKNHYDTLEIQSDCTQNEVKSAYYKLSKQYHPDVNSSIDAKKKFQNISDAYDTLGNFSKRKQYDRNLVARGSKAASQEVCSTVEVDPLASFYRSHMSNYDPLTNNTKTYNFDAWTHAHYGSILRRSINYKNSKILRETLEAEHEKEVLKSKGASIFLGTSCILTIIALLIQAYHNRTGYDKDYVTAKHKNNK